MFEGFTTEKQTTMSPSLGIKAVRPYIEWGTSQKSKQRKKTKKKAKKGGKAPKHAEINRELIPVFYQAIAGMDRANQRLCELLERSLESTEDNRRGVWMNGKLYWIRRKLRSDWEVVL